MHAEIFYVDVPSEAGVEKQVPAGMMIVVVDVDAVAVPFPIAAAIEVVRGNHPIRVVIEHDAARPVIDAPGDKLRSHMIVAAVWIGPPRADALVFGIPVGVRITLIVPSPVVSVVMPVAIIAAIFVFVLAFVLSVVVMIVTVLRRCSG